MAADTKMLKEFSVYWINKASSFRESAAILWAITKDGRFDKIFEDFEDLEFGSNFSKMQETYPIYVMLCGLSLELLYKAIIVAKGMKLNTRNHNLIEYASSANVPIAGKEGLLNILSHYITWAGRYPVPKNEIHIEELRNLKYKFLDKKISFGKLVMSKPGSIKWESYDELWVDALEVYYEHHSEEDELRRYQGDRL